MTNPMQNKNLLILGAGQYGVMAKEIAEAMGVFERIAFLDDSFAKDPAAAAEHSVVGTTRDIEKFTAEFRYGFVAIGNPELRRRLTEQLLQNNMTPVTLVHPTAYVSPSAQLEQGCCIEPNATVQTGATLKTATFIASGAVVRHNAIVGEYCHVDCNAVVNSTANIPAGTHILAQEAPHA
jgi:UDP-3-O-[3-hydroxymyristoyl] glucosamine N-acyltransferase